jgi:hypothetical protein
MSARITAKPNNGLIAHTILGGKIPPLPQPLTSASRIQRCTPIPQSPAETNAWCMTCRAPMVSHAGKKAGEWECKPCGFRIPFHLKSELRRRFDNAIRIGTYYRNAWCAVCQVPMKNTGPKRCKLWKCTKCCKTTPKQSVGEQYPDEPPRPVCLTCENELHHRGKTKWACTWCGYIRAKQKSRHRKQPYRPNNPHCLMCQYQMKSTGAAKKKEWVCGWCGRCIEQHHNGPMMAYKKRRDVVIEVIDGDELMRFCFAAVPRHFTNRDDVVQELVMLILSNELSREAVTPLKVRQIDRELLKRHHNYRDVSMESLICEGVRLEERLVG